MPIYEYQCEACGHTFEELQKITDAPLVHCPVCEKDEVRRLISKTSFQLKGGGWYKDLYGSSSSASSTGSSHKHQAKSGDTKSTSESAGTKSSASTSSDSKSSSSSSSASSSGTKAKAS